MYSAQKRYEALSITSRIEGASPHELVVILYEELLRSLDVARSRRASSAIRAETSRRCLAESTDRCEGSCPRSAPETLQRSWRL